MKNILAFILLISSITTAQHSVKGVMSTKLKTNWVILYKVEGTKQVFVNNTTIKNDSLVIDGKKQAVGRFEFKMPLNAKPGAYRVNYRLEGATYVDFFYNKENVSFIFNPDQPEQTIVFSESSENKLYQNFIEDVSIAQKKIDSIQIAALQNKNLNLKTEYNKAYKNIDAIQKEYLKISKNKYVAPFIEALIQNHPKEIVTSVNEYMANIKNNYFNKVQFSNKTLINSSFLTNKILGYIFYINYSDDLKKQKTLFKQSIDTVLSKIKNNTYKKDIIEFLIAQFESAKNLEIIDYLFQNHYYKLPKTIQNQQFISEKKALFAVEVGRIAPDFSWKENGKTLKLSTLNDGDKYVLVFWSTGCSHCLREIPQLHTYMKNKSNMKVISFALEENSFAWQNYSKTNLYGWHNVLGLKKWANKTAKTYQVYATPTYFILDKNKKIIYKPNEIKDVKLFLEKQ